MFRKMLIAALFIALIPTAGFSLDTNLLNDFVTLDKAYVPALFLTNMDKRGPSKQSMERLKAEWRTFKDKYYNYNSSDPQWNKDFDKIGQKIDEADRIVSSEGDLIAAHETLEAVRYTLIDTRRRNHIDYFIDYLTDFHDPMEHIVLRAKGKTPQTLSSDDLDFIESSLPETMTLWEKAITSNVDQTLFRLNDGQMEQLRNLMTAESGSLADLKAALADKTAKADIIKKAMGIKKNFSQVFGIFGDFSGLN